MTVSGIQAGEKDFSPRQREGSEKAKSGRRRERENAKGRKRERNAEGFGLPAAGPPSARSGSVPFSCFRPFAFSRLISVGSLSRFRGKTSERLSAGTPE
jgi:hypothetical protein